MPITLFDHRYPEGLAERNALDRYLVVMLGAAVGGLARYVAGTAIMDKYGGAISAGYGDH